MPAPLEKGACACAGVLQRPSYCGREAPGSTRGIRALNPDASWPARGRWQGAVADVARLVEALDRAIDELPKEGLKAAKAVSLVSRLRGVAEGVASLLSKAKCLAEAKGAVRKASEASVGDTLCASIRFYETPSEAGVFKTKIHAFSAKIVNGSVIVSDENFKLEIGGQEARIHLPAGDGKEEASTRLNDVDDLNRNYYHLAYVLKRLERHLAVALADLEACARREALQC